MVPGISLKNDMPSIYGADTPLLAIDGVVYDAEILKNLNPGDIDFIEVLKGAEGAIYGMRGGHGVIYIHTLNGPRKDFKTSANGLQNILCKKDLLILLFSPL